MYLVKEKMAKEKQSSRQGTLAGRNDLRLAPGVESSVDEPGHGSGFTLLEGGKDKTKEAGRNVGCTTTGLALADGIATETEERRDNVMIMVTDSVAAEQTSNGLTPSGVVVEDTSTTNTLDDDSTLQPGAVAIPGIHHGISSGRSIRDDSAATTTVRPTPNPNNHHDDDPSLIVANAVTTDDDIEGRVQERLQEQSEQIRQTILNEAAQADIVEDEEDTKRRFRRMVLLAGIAILMVTIAAVVIPVSLIASRSNKDDDSVSLTYQEELSQVLLSMYPEDSNYVTNGTLLNGGNSSLFVPDTPQDRAFRWMLNEDQHVVMNYHDTPNTIKNVVAPKDLIGINVQSIRSLVLHRFATVVFYYSTNGETWYNQYKFLNTTTSICQWNNKEQLTTMTKTDDDDSVDERVVLGVADCDPTTEEIVQLRLIDNHLNGTIPYEISWLTTLQTLALSDNVLHGSLPDTFGTTLQLLDTLHLDSNQITGTIPDTLGEGSNNLRSINLNHNGLKGTIPSSLTQNLRQLQTLQLRHNGLTGTLPEFQVRSLLEMVDVRHNQISGTIPPTIYKNGRLRYLNLYNNFISGTLSNEMNSLLELQSLVLGQNQIIGTIPVEMGWLTKLEHVFLQSNDLSGTIPTELGLLNQLSGLYLNHNRLHGTLPEILFEQTTNLYVLHLHSNPQLHGTIPKSWSGLKVLAQLYVHNTSLAGDLDFVCDTSNVTAPSISDLLYNDVELEELPDSDDWESFQRTSFLEVIADCGGEHPEVTCTCCQSCCEDTVGCSSDAGRLSCEQFVNENDVIASYCDCAPYNNSFHPKMDGVIDYTDMYTATCRLPPPIVFWHCNENDDDCATFSFGVHFDRYGRTAGQFETYEYVSGTYNGQMVHMDDFFDEASCSVVVNGQTCRHCSPLVCDDGYGTYSISCTNVEQGAIFNECTGETNGILQVFLPQYDLENAQVGALPPPSVATPCSNVATFAETYDENLHYECQCDETGYFVSCRENCQRCLDGTGSINGTTVCFVHGWEAELDDSNGGNVDFVSSLVSYQYTSPTVYNGTTIQSNDIHYQQLGTCELFVNGEQCQGCNKIICPETGNENFLIDCQNLSSSSSMDLDVGSAALYGCDETSVKNSGILQIFRPDLLTVTECIPF